jgi:iron complex outermembrane receptor protein
MSFSSYKKTVFGSVAVSALMLSGMAHAQEEGTEEVVEIVEEDTSEARQEKIIVTGSLIARDEFSSSSPIQVITAEVATLEGLVDTASLLQGSSLASGATQLNNTFQNFVTNGGVGSQTIDLRGCGDTRTLVLIDGKRPGPAGTRGGVSSVDLNTIPQSAVSRIEILKDGASTIYGSDAVCGVVNIITRDAVDSPELNVFASQPFEQGGEEYRISGAFGFELADIGTIAFSAEYRLQEELDGADRDYLDCATDRVRDPDTGEIIDRRDQSARPAGPFGCDNIYHDTVIDQFSGERLIPSPDGSTGPTAFGGSITGYRPRVGTGTNPDGTLFFEDILDGDFYDNTDYRPKNENISFMATSDFTFGNGMNWDSELLLTRRTTEIEGWRQFFPSVGSALNPAGNNPGFGYISDPTYSNDIQSLALPVLPFPTYDKVEQDYLMVSSELSGQFGIDALSEWGWRLTGIYSKSDATYEGNEILNARSGDWGIDGVDYNDDGVADFIAPPSVNFLDPDFLNGTRANDLVAAIGGYQSGTTTYEQTQFTAVATGPLFELPAGDVNIGIGAEYREFEIDDQPGVLTQTGEVWGSSVSKPTQGTNEVMEIFAELDVPIIKGAAFAEELTLNLSGRAFDYDVGGEDSIYKVGLNWQINPTLRLRSSFGTSYRAPALFETYLDDELAFFSQLNDPCNNVDVTTNQNLIDNCAAVGITTANINQVGNGSSGSIRTFGSASQTVQDIILDRFDQDTLDLYNELTGGPGGLRPETSETFTAGFVFSPTFTDLRVAIDYYEVEIEDQITRLSAGQVLGGCYGAVNFPNTFCDLIIRNPGTAPGTNAFRITEVIAPIINLDSQQQRGIDLEARYEKGFTFGDLIVEGSVNWALERYISVFGSELDTGVANDDFNGSIGFPNVVGNADIRLERGDFTYSWFIDYIGHQDNNRDFVADLNLPANYFGLQGLYDVETEAVFYHGASVRWEGDTWTFTAGISNLFDEHPPAVSSGQVTTVGGNTPVNATGYDVIGRRGFIEVSKTF